jgi:uncharacterized protein (TIGR03435 family)
MPNESVAGQRDISGGMVMKAFVSIAIGLTLSLLTVAAQTPDAARPAFDVASVKPNTAPACVRFQCGVTTQPKSGRLVIQYYSLVQLVRTAFSVRTDDIVGGPPWRDDDKFDIEGKADGPVPNDQTLYLMLQSLLADRFKLAVHRETRDVPMYGLVVGKGGARLKRVAAVNPQNSGQPASGGGRGFPGAGTLQLIRRDENIRQVSGQASMSELATFLSRVSGRSVIEAGRPVFDETGLTGNFEIKLEWLAESGFPGELDPGLVSAIEGTLGLKIENRKGAGEVLVIDHAEKPSRN